MIPLSTLTDRLSTALELPKATVQATARHMREAGVLPTGTQGREIAYKAHCDEGHSIALLLALLSGAGPTDSVRASADLSGLVLSEALALCDEGNIRLGPDEPTNEARMGWAALVASGETLGEHLATYLFAMVNDVEQGALLDFIGVHDWPMDSSVMLTASDGHFTFVIQFRPVGRRIERPVTALTKSNHCSGEIMAVLAATHRAGLAHFNERLSANEDRVNSGMRMQ